jgi:hypothetical protein
MNLTFVSQSLFTAVIYKHRQVGNCHNLKLILPAYNPVELHILLASVSLTIKQMNPNYPYQNRCCITISEIGRQLTTDLQECLFDILNECFIDLLNSCRQSECLFSQHDSVLEC